MRRLTLLLLASFCCDLLPAQSAEFLGSETCRECHEEIFESQSRSRMAQTWWEPGRGVFRDDYLKTASENGFRYQVKAQGEGLTFSVQGADGARIEVPVKFLTGGSRFGVGFLLKLATVAGTRLFRPALLEARFMHDLDRGRLVLAPGHEQFRPTSPLNAMGRVLKPGFQERCLTCHGSPQHTSSAAPGIHCERCHGPGGGHLPALEGGEETGIVNPAKLGNRGLVEFCGQCHSGFSDLFQPRPEDLLISDQARALSLSECFVQSDAGVGCLDCHDPHQDASPTDPRYEAACRGCHQAEQGKAAACPVNPRSDCVNCHMPQVEANGLRVRDHWIRVPIDLKGKHELTRDVPGSRLEPRQIFLRMLVVRDRATAVDLRRQIVEGAAFSQIARSHSIDPSARLGGFLGARETHRLSSALREQARLLAHGRVSEVVELGREYALVQRPPRDFRQDAWALERKGSQLLAAGQLDQALNALLQAVETDPHCLRCYHALAAGYGAKRDLGKLLETLRQAQYLFPRDPDTAFRLARAYAAVGESEKQQEWLQRALQLDPEMISAHLLLGTGYFSRRDWPRAAHHFETAARLNPLSAAAYYQLGQTRKMQGREAEANRWLALAEALAVH